MGGAGGQQLVLDRADPPPMSITVAPSTPSVLSASISILVDGIGPWRDSCAAQMRPYLRCRNPRSPSSSANHASALASPSSLRSSRALSPRWMMRPTNGAAVAGNSIELALAPIVQLRKGSGDRCLSDLLLPHYITNCSECRARVGVW